MRIILRHYLVSRADDDISKLPGGLVEGDCAKALIARTYLNSGLPGRKNATAPSTAG
jgi:hypothetical protein